MTQAERNAAGSKQARPQGAPLAVIEEWLAPLGGRRLLDVGCGRGALARRLVARDAQVVGVDPQPQTIAAARELVPEAEFRETGAQALPFADSAFDAAVLLNSFHHVPLSLMDAALGEVLRVCAGPVLVIEPLAEGPFFEVMRPVEDETEQRLAAQAVITRTVEVGAARLLRAHDFDDVRSFADVDAFLAKVIAADPARAETAARLRGEVEALMRQWGTPEGEGLRLDQPHRALLLQKADHL
ncbi:MULTISPECIES: class I SAM-dependent methyltransferase [unclassified Xanthobacter]|uniref:class I SAM-dependent methyltransferase n=1 Tax=unclassified Xanthobacter TaxID=2623496 RepID=UPI001F358CC1|nr:MULTISPECIES: class I SAM-dependent methyltransferase [unclassified Xanthobacter]